MSLHNPDDADGLVIPPGPNRGAWLDDAPPPTDPTDTTDHDDDDDGPKPTQASMLVELAERRWWLGTSDLGEAFAVEHDGPMIARLLHGHGSLRAEMASAFVTEHGRVPSSSALADAMMVLEGRALSGPRCQLALRVGRDDHGALIVDLGTEDGRAARVTGDGWTIEPTSPILFRRTSLTGPLPVPTGDGDLERLRTLVNIADDDWPLLLACLVAALVPEIPHPIIGFLGRQGSAKTTTAKLVSAVVDPSAAQTRSAPRDVESWVVAASGSWIVVLDNVSRVPQWLSDALCRAATGDALVRRKLYTDGDLAVIAFRRVVAITSIDPGALAGDLAERLVAFELHSITETDRQQDADVTSAFVAAHPTILAGLLDLAAQVLAVLPDVNLDRYPRMADFARIVAAVDQVLGTEALDRYLGGRARIAEDVVDGDRVASGIRDLVPADGDTWQGSASELLETLTARLTDPDRPGKDWPASPRGMTSALTRCADALALVGVEVNDAGHDPASRRKRYRIQRFEPFDPSQPTVGPHEQPNDAEGLTEGLPDPQPNPSPDPSHRNGHEQAAITPSEASKGPKGSTRPLSADRGYRCEGCAVRIDRPYWCDDCAREPVEREGAA